MSTNYNMMCPECDEDIEGKLYRLMIDANSEEERTMLCPRCGAALVVYYCIVVETEKKEEKAETEEKDIPRPHPATCNYKICSECYNADCTFWDQFDE